MCQNILNSNREKDKSEKKKELRRKKKHDRNLRDNLLKAIKCHLNFQ